MSSRCCRPPTEDTDNKAVVLTFFEHLSAGRLDEAVALLADDVEYAVIGRPADFPHVPRMDDHRQVRATTSPQSESGRAIR